MKCSKCGNTSNFNIFFDRLFETVFKNKKISSVKEVGSDFAQIYPVFCSNCGDMGVEFNHKELREIAKRINKDCG